MKALSLYQQKDPHWLFCGPEYYLAPEETTSIWQQSFPRDWEYSAVRYGFTLQLSWVFAVCDAVFLLCGFFPDWTWSWYVHWTDTV